MSNVCEKCGWTLDGAQRFCPNCGAPVNTSPPETASRKFCAGCGASLAGDAKFCAKCGAPCATTESAATGSAPATSPSVIPASNRSGLKIFAVVLALFAVVTVLIVGGVAYVGYRAKKKVDAIRQSSQQDGLNQVLQALSGNAAPQNSSEPPGTAKPDETPVAPAPHFEPIAPAAQSSPASTIPLSAGLHVVGYMNDPSGWGDYEFSTTVESVTPKGVSVSSSSEAPSGGSTSPGSGPANGSVRTMTVHRTILEQDLLHAHAEMILQSQLFPDTFPGTTDFQFSVDQLSELKLNGQTADSETSIEPGLAGNLTTISALMTPDPWAALPKSTCTLTRVESTDVAVPVIVNNQRTELPAIHTLCKKDSGTFDTYVLDNAENPINLGSNNSNGSMRSAITEITFLTKQPSRQIEESLAQTGRAQVYGIHFDFASATLRPESEAVLKQIAQAMTEHPDWKISVEGHTDNIGGDAYNQDLSNKRAVAVAQALVERYHISAGRFTPVGYGASRPVAANDTIQGRALNRRVELVRQ